MEIRAWRVNPATIGLGPVLDWSLNEQRANRLLMVIRMEARRGKWRPLEPRAEAWATRRLAEFAIESFLAQGWPGTLLTGHPALIHVLELNEMVKDVILRTEARLDRWLHNRETPLPEDLCFFRAEAELPVFYSVTHESSAWIISHARPRMKGLRPDFATVEESYIFSGEYFCQRWAASRTT